VSEEELRSDVRNRLAAYLLYETRSVVDELFPVVPVRWGGSESDAGVQRETLGLPVLSQGLRDVVFQELHRISVRVMNPELVFTDEEIDARLLDEEIKG
jgi:hypothetical protein